MGAAPERATEVHGRLWTCCEHLRPPWMRCDDSLDPSLHATVSEGEELRRHGLGRPGRALGSDGPGALVRLWTGWESERRSKESETGLGWAVAPALGRLEIPDPWGMRARSVGATLSREQTCPPRGIGAACHPERPRGDSGRADAPPSH
ncbi:hypothetical protein NDU88_005006 [Pleurodeles waltl]|uniref:Uncharacterized protein n=1 Tax=Pleurodeles waltl TaxID=8319 RepID=A0AAV7WXK6_PLEWA|nr:hypothetical protein NDU88_005006 [Pleurodeles waltl]